MMGAGSGLSCHPWVPEPSSAHFLASATHSNNNLGAHLRAPGCAGYFSPKHRRQGLLLFALHGEVSLKEKAAQKKASGAVSIIF